jgi:D-serine deaminase-like pyridoxal phosphate-dependent protein
VTDTAQHTGATAATPAPTPPSAYDTVFAGLEAPFAFVDVDATRANAERMLISAGGKPIRIASKSVRSRALLERFLGYSDRFQGLLNLTLPEALWLHEHGFSDLVVAYPTVAPSQLEALAAATRRDPDGAPTVMVDSAAHLDLISAHVRHGQPPVKICIDLDVGWRPLRGLVQLGPKRSPIHDAAGAAALAREITRRPWLKLVGVMAYEGLIAGVADMVPGRRLENLAIQAIKRWSTVDVARRRAEMVAAITQTAGELTFVNGGGTGSIGSTTAEAAVTEATAGSGFYAPQLFQYYRELSLAPAAGYALPVSRRPTPQVATALGGGYIASGATRPDRQPVPFWPAGLKLDPQEGAGEAQTPLLGDGAASLEIGANVYMRHAKAGELCERFNALYVVSGGSVVDEVPTYRGEGKAFL